jgi:hypothetical protein
MSAGMIVAMGIYHLAIFIFVLLGIAAAIKYLRCRWPPVTTLGRPNTKA